MGSACSSNKKNVKNPKNKKAKGDKKGQSSQNYSEDKKESPETQILPEPVPRPRGASIKRPNRLIIKEEESERSEDNSNSSAQESPISGKVRTIKTVAYKKRERSSSQESSGEGEDSEEGSESGSYVGTLNKSSLTDRVSRGRHSAISSKYHNAILKLIEKTDSDNYETVIKNLDKNQYSLKTALMMPLEEYIEQNQSKETGVAVYQEYTPTEELYGIFLAIDTREWKIFRYLFEKRGSIWNEKHLIPIIRHMVDTEWEDGIYSLFKLNRTKEMYLSMYSNERKAFYDTMEEILEDLVSDMSSNNIILRQMMKGLVLKPYATLTFLYLFHYIHVSRAKIQAKDVDPQQ
eukprot:CAMPEP_0196998688 /NCGR_PEP_ID=MMETSP1380-20130617/4023_1 /TAXON_ID=5936 /ORGANISM="Euplotes crassus, Strain CT5" /LENGTH=347 /DNA_ID=CAMNT_0042415353 /DNA_START=14 /DNA_END=1057 /DNA_ORIENTATION=-